MASGDLPLRIPFEALVAKLSWQGKGYNVTCQNDLFK